MKTLLKRIGGIFVDLDFLRSEFMVAHICRIAVPELESFSPWKQLVIPRLDYCSQIWNPYKLYEIQDLESVPVSYVKSQELAA